MDGPSGASTSENPGALPLDPALAGTIEDDEDEWEYEYSTTETEVGTHAGLNSSFATPADNADAHRLFI